MTTSSHKNKAIVACLLFIAVALSILVVSLKPAGAAGSTYYVDIQNPGCNDSGPGTQSNPWCTFTKASNTAQAGDTILFADGIYSVPPNYDLPRSGVPGNPITFKANGTAVYINAAGGGANAFFFKTASYITLDGFKFQNANSCIGFWPTEDLFGITLKNLDTTGGCSSAIYVSANPPNRIIGLVVDNVRMIRQTGAYLDYTTNAVVRNSFFDGGQEYTDSTPLYILNSDNPLVENNEFRHFYRHTVECGSGFDQGSTNMTIRNNIFYRIHDVKVDDCQNVVVQHNTFILEHEVPNEGWISYNGQYGTTGVTLKDNLFVETGHISASISEPAIMDYNYWVNTIWGPTGYIIDCDNCPRDPYYDLSLWVEDTGRDTHSRQDKTLTRYDIFIDPDNFNFTPRADSWICNNPANLGSDGQPIGALGCPAGANNPPVLAPIGPKTLNEGDVFSFGMTATDADAGDTVTLSASNLPVGATFIDNGNRTGTFNWTPTTSQAGTYNNVHFEVTDGTVTDSEDITITVQDGLASCTPNWSCTDWLACSNSLQTRTCTDQNACGTDTGRPPESQACDSTAPEGISNLRVE